MSEKDGNENETIIEEQNMRIKKLREQKKIMHRKYQEELFKLKAKCARLERVVSEQKLEIGDLKCKMHQVEESNPKERVKRPVLTIDTENLDQVSYEKKSNHTTRSSPRKRKIRSPRSPRGIHKKKSGAKAHLLKMRKKLNLGNFDFPFPVNKKEFYNRFKEYEMQVERENNKIDLLSDSPRKNGETSDLIMMKVAEEYLLNKFILRKIEFVLDHESFQKIEKIVDRYRPVKHKENIGKVLYVMKKIVFCCNKLGLYEEGIRISSRILNIVQEIRSRDIREFNTDFSKSYGLDRTIIAEIMIEKEKLAKKAYRPRRRKEKMSCIGPIGELFVTAGTLNHLIAEGEDGIGSPVMSPLPDSGGKNMFDFVL